MSDTVGALDTHGRNLAERYGVHSDPYPIDPPNRSGSPAVDLVTRLMVPTRTFQLTRHEGVWGIYYRESATIGSGPAEMRAVTACTITVKREFLVHSGPFFEQYLERVRGMLNEIDAEVAQARHVLGRLAELG